MQNHFYWLICSELGCESQCSHKVEVRLNDKIVFTKSNFFVELDLLWLTLAQFIDETTIYLLELFFFEAKTCRNFFREIETKVTYHFTLEHFLGLVELLTH